MKYYKRLNVYKASNVSFNPEEIAAYSYDWWQFVKVVDGKVFFNNYSYSQSTNGHQSKVRHLLGELNIEIDCVIDCPSGFQDGGWQRSSINLYKQRIEELERLIKKPKTRKAKNEERKQEIKHYLQCIRVVQSTLFKNRIQLDLNSY